MITSLRGRIGSATPQFFALLSGRLYSAVMQAVLLVVLARTTSPREFGYVATYLAVTVFVTSAADMGTESLAIRSLARGETGEFVAAVGVHKVLMCFVASLVGLFTVIGGLAWGHLFFELLPLAAWLFAERRLSLFTGVMLVQGSAIGNCLVLVAARSVSVILLLVWSWLAMGSLAFGFATASLLGTCAGLMWASSGDLPGIEAVCVLPSRRDVVARASAFWLANFSGQLRALDTPWVAMLIGATGAGLYALPSRAVAPLRLVATSLGSLSLPYAAKGDMGALMKLSRGMWFSLTAFGVMAIPLWFALPTLVEGVLGRSYAGSGEVLRVLLVGVAINIPGAYWSGVLQGTGHERYISHVGAVLIPTFFLCVTLGTVAHGAVGAAWGVTASYAVQLCLVGLKARRRGFEGER